jgi:hypothetical protein
MAIGIVLNLSCVLFLDGGKLIYLALYKIIIITTPIFDCISYFYIP